MMFSIGFFLEKNTTFFGIQWQVTIISEIVTGG